MGLFKKEGEDKHLSFGAGSLPDALKEAETKGGVERVDKAHQGKGQPVIHVHTQDGSVINVVPALKDPIDEE